MDGGTALIAVIGKAKTGTTTEVGRYKGFTLSVEKNFMGINYVVISGKTDFAKPFEYEEKLKEKLKRQYEINAELDLDRGEKSENLSQEKEEHYYILLLGLLFSQSLFYAVCVIESRRSTILKRLE